LNQEFTLIAGVDEAGRGPLAGPVITAAVILPAQYQLPGLNDSKKLTEKQRIKLEKLIKSQAICWMTGRSDPDEIDKINILWATMLAMKRAVEGLSVQPERVLVDGNRCPELSIEVEAIIKGDETEPVISAASIIAKQTRDREMIALDKQYPEYGFSSHKGYPTKKHIEALHRYGPTSIHRRSYGPVRNILEGKD